MPRNVFGEVGGEGLTNPLTEDLQGADFNIYDINELHINELHDQDGIDKIAVHEDFNMLNNQITNMADPIQSKDATTKQYVDGLIGSPFYSYDFAGAFTDETTPLAAGAIVTVNQTPRDFTMLFIDAYLTNAATSNSFDVQVFRDTNLIGTCNFASGSRKSTTGIVFVGGYSALQGERYTCSIPVADATASGLKLVFLGQRSQ